METSREHRILVDLLDKICILLDKGFVRIFLSNKQVIFITHDHNWFVMTHVISQIVNRPLNVFEALGGAIGRIVDHDGTM